MTHDGTQNVNECLNSTNGLRCMKTALRIDSIYHFMEDIERRIQPSGVAEVEDNLCSPIYRLVNFLSGWPFLFMYDSVFLNSEWVEIKLIQ